ncbi:hypothetical protein BsIDN1_61650 [Bacillus safensis]|uniref:Uncharacterized protein n=1 Tax=Bacillus safensis TaxID=561879 RepID=A0A5S9MGD9_BACIA|nr:hypothetical protein BsIDN1_61650 [Bacillus safensis]
MFKDLTSHEKIYPQELREMLIQYFKKKMGAEHHVLKGNEDIYADIFISTYFGFFFIQQLEQDFQLVLTKKKILLKYAHTFS